MQHIMTVDLEDWFHGLDIPHTEWSRYPSRIEFSTNQLLEFMDSFQVKATFFVLGDIAAKNPRLIRTIQELGHEIASHGYIHHRYTLLPEKEIRADIDESISILADITGTRPVGFRAPCFSIDQENMWILDYLAQQDIQYDSSMFPIKIDRYGIQGMKTKPHRIQTSTGSIYEFPITPSRYSFIRIPFAGGAYFRVIPFGVVNKLFARAQSIDKVVTFYIHPWELDLYQPRIPVVFRLRLPHYFGLKRFSGKLKKLFAHYRFGPIREYIDRNLTVLDTH